MKKILFICFFFFAFATHGQVKNMPDIQTPDHTPMMNKTWEAIDKMMYRVSTEGNKKVYTPHYPPELKKLEHTLVDIPGYMIPLSSGRNHANFMISVLPINQCQFCGTNGIPPMVEVFLKKGTTIRYTEEPVRLKGKMKFNPEPLKGNSEIQIIDAEVIK